MEEANSKHSRAGGAYQTPEAKVRLHIHGRVCDALGSYLEEMDAASLKKISAVQQSPQLIGKILEYHLERSILKDKFNAATNALKGLKERMELLESDGGAVSSSEVARLLGLTRQAVDIRRKKNKLLAVYLDGRNDYFYPVWQFGESGLKKNFERISAHLEHLDPWMRLVFWLSKNVYLKNERPLDALKNDQKADLIIRAAEMTGEQGGQ